MIDAIIRDAFATDPTSFTYVDGGSINQAARVQVCGETYFVKWKYDAPTGFFEAEAHGLALLRSTNTIRVPEVIHVSKVENEPRSAYLILEWLEAAQNVGTLAFSVDFARALASLHRVREAAFGLDRDNFIGSLPQKNALSADWAAFYRDQRLAPQIALAASRGRLPSERERALRKLLDNVDRWLSSSLVLPSLLHGDLWSGNFMVLAGNQPVIFDPAVYYGDREVELAFTELFGGFPDAFYTAYQETFPLEPGYERRRPLYQLYPSLVHLNLFGEAYGARVDAVCRYYLS